LRDPGMRKLGSRLKSGGRGGGWKSYGRDRRGGAFPAPRGTRGARAHMGGRRRGGAKRRLLWACREEKGRYHNTNEEY